jgi:O-antigen/teichoic acid export membrane protein
MRNLNLIETCKKIFLSGYTASSVVYYLMNILSTLAISFLYGLSIYGQYIFTISIFSIVSFLTTFKLEILISNLKNKVKKQFYFAQQIYATYVASIFFSLLILVVNKYFNFLYFDFDLNSLIIVFSLIASPAITIILNQLLLINGDYKKVTILRFLPGFILLLFQISFHFFLNTFKGLLISTTIANLIFIISVLLIFLNKYKINFYSYLNFVKNQKKVISLLIPSSILNTLNQQFPNIIIKYFSGYNMLGSFSLFNKIFGSPGNVFAPFILERFKKEINTAVEYKNNLFPIYQKILNILLLFALLSLLISLFFYHYKIPKYLFSYSDNYNVYFLLIVFSIRSFVSPLTYFIYFSEKIKYDLLIQLAHFILLIIFILFSININPINYVNSIQIMIYITYFFLINKTIKNA